MTTEQHPAEQPAATEQTGQASATDEQPPTDDAARPLAPATPPTSEDDPSSPADAAPATTQQPAAAPPISSRDEGGSAGSTPPSSPPVLESPPQRRVRLNPTIPPGVARAVPSLRHSDPAQAATTQPQPVAHPQTSDDPSPTTMSDVEVDDSPSTAEPTETQTTPETNAPAPPQAPPVALPSRSQSLDADLEAELEAAMAGSDQQSIAASQPPDTDDIAEQDAAAPLTPDVEVKQGMKLTGTVASIHGDDMFLDFGLRMPGVLSRRQFGLRKQPMQGESLAVVVGRVDENEGLMHVNLPTGTSRVRGEWDALSVDQNVECMVTGTNKGGLEVSIGALRGFMPASQVELGFVSDLNVFVGQKLKARIAEVNPKRRKLVLSRRALLEEEREHSQQELFQTIEPGQQYTGRVRTLKDYGAFVDIGGADGLLHVAQISWSRINHPSEVLKEGEEIQVQVLSVDKDKKKISLGMRQLTQNPWKSAESKYAQGAQITGKVTRLENFGAFIELDEGVEGLVHISELDHKRVNKVSEVLRVGQEVNVQVLEVDPKRKRVSLSLKALKEKPDDPQQRAESEPIKRQRSVDSLVGGMGEPTGGKLFGDPNKFGR